MTKAFSKYVGGDMIRANVDSRMHLKTKKYRMLGSTKFTSIDVGRDHDTGDARGTEVILTACQDQTELKIVDQSGSVVTDEQKDIPSFLLRQYTVLKTQGSAQWRIYGMETVKGACG